MEPVLRASNDDELFRQAKQLGFSGVEVVLSRQALDRLEPLARAQRAYGLAVPSLVLGEHSDLGGIADTDPALAEHARRDVERSIEWAAELRAEAILVPFFGRAELRDDADLERAAVAFRPLYELAAEREVTLCYEGTLQAERINALAERVGSRAFGCYFDLANAVVRGMDSATEFGAGEWERLIETCRSFGLQAVQLGNPMLEECLEHPEHIPTIRRTLDDAGVSIAALAGYRNLVAPDPETRRANLDFLARCLELAAAFGTSIVATETGTRSPDGDWIDSPDNWRAEAWELVDDAVAALLPVAERSGAILALEGSVKNVLRTHGQLIGLLERFPSQHLQLVLDPYNYLSGHLVSSQERVTREFLSRFEHRFVIAHLKDIDPGGADVATIEFGTGAFAQAPYLEFLATKRPDLPLILEHLPLDHVPDAIERVRATGT